MEEKTNYYLTNISLVIIQIIWGGSKSLGFKYKKMFVCCKLPGIFLHTKYHHKTFENEGNHQHCFPLFEPELRYNAYFNVS